MPKFKHDCKNCRFLGTFFDHDVYICEQPEILGSSIIARYGDAGPEYASHPLKSLKDSLMGDGTIGGKNEDGTSWSMPYKEWIFSDRSIPSTSAMILALALKAMN